MPNLSPKENYLRALRHEQTEYVPFSGVDAVRCVATVPADRGTQASNFLDGFGVRWAATDFALNGLIPAPGEFMLKDITRWKTDVPIPDVEKYDWQKFADENGAATVKRDTLAVGYYGHTGIWERLAALMGFEEAMIALMEEPEACDELFAAITDFKIKLVEKIATYFKPDFFVNFDDIATQQNLFMSPETYRALIKPHHKRLNDAVLNVGIIPVQHTCGHAEICVEDYIETGAVSWSAVQTSNDITKLLDKYGDRFSFEGGFDSNGKPGQPNATIPEIQAEVERCFREYGSKKGFMFSGTALASVSNKNAAEKNTAIRETLNALRFAGK
jgi:hypothetical protein